MTFFSRSDWGALTPRWTNVMGRPVNTVFIHHSVTANPKTDADQLALVKQIEGWHRAQGWPDIGYNFLVAKGPGDKGKAANRFEGRGWGIRPTAQGSHNAAGYAHLLPRKLREPQS